jgi:hypothetical protein
MDYTLWSIIGTQALLALILWLQNRQLNAQSELVFISLQDMVERGVVKIIEEEDEDEQY